MLGLSCLDDWWHLRPGSGLTDPRRPSASGAEQPVGSLVLRSWFSLDTGSPARPRRARRDLLLQQVEHAQTQPAASPHSHPAVSPQPGISSYAVHQQGSNGRICQTVTRRLSSNRWNGGRCVFNVLLYGHVFYLDDKNLIVIHQTV